MVNLIKILDTAETEQAVGFWLRNIKKAQLIIIDEIGYTPISRGQANRFFTFISVTYETSSTIFTTNMEIVDWAEMMGDPVLTTAMRTGYCIMQSATPLGRILLLKPPRVISSYLRTHCLVL